MADVKEWDATLFQEIVRRIVAVTNPEQIIVFGSRARGITGAIATSSCWLSMSRRSRDISVPGRCTAH